MSKRKRRKFTKEQKAEAVRLVRTSGESLAQVARNLGIGDNSLRHWVKQADIDEGKGPDGALTTAERDIGVRGIRYLCRRAAHSGRDDQCLHHEPGGDWRPEGNASATANT